MMNCIVMNANNRFRHLWCCVFYFYRSRHILLMLTRHLSRSGRRGTQPFQVFAGRDFRVEVVSPLIRRDFLQPLCSSNFLAPFKSRLPCLERLLKLFVTHVRVSQLQKGLAGELCTYAAMLQLLSVTAAFMYRTCIDLHQLGPKGLAVHHRAS